MANKRIREVRALQQALTLAAVQVNAARNDITVGVGGPWLDLLCERDNVDAAGVDLYRAWRQLDALLWEMEANDGR